MLHRQSLARTICWILCAFISTSAIAAEVSNSAASKNVLDLKLQEHGTLVGKLVDRQGKALPSVNVQVLTKRGSLTTARTNQQGIFTARGFTSGEMLVRVGEQAQLIRAWNADLAPPTAPSAAMLVVGDTVRGQCCEPSPCAPACDDMGSCCSAGCDGCGGCDSCCAGGLFGGSAGGGGLLGSSGGGLLGSGGVLSNPYILGAGVAAAVAIPIAIDDDDAS